MALKPMPTSCEPTRTLKIELRRTAIEANPVTITCAARTLTGSEASAKPNVQPNRWDTHKPATATTALIAT